MTTLAPSARIVAEKVGGDLAIDLAHIAKTYKGKVQALRGIQMHVRRGEVFGLLGPNGAGKSTLVKILMTVVRASKCSGTLLGAPVGHKATLARVGYLPEHHQFAGYLTGAQVIDFYGAMTGVPRRARRQRTGELLELVGMSAWAKKRVRGYSKGMRQRIGIAQALVNNPDLVMLDEPTDGVDPVGRRDIRNILSRLRDEGKTVFLNSHLLSELEMVCDRVAILVQGVVSAQGTIDELTRDKQRYEIELATPAGEGGLDETVVRALPAAWEAVDRMALTGAPPTLPTADVTTGLARRVGYRGSLATGEAIEVDHSMIRIGTTDPVTVQPVLDALRGRGMVIRSVRPVRPSLEDLFMQAVTDPNTGEILAPGAARPGKSGRGGKP
jgi:ABC-2 type transport system ATP-binding protein